MVSKFEDLEVYQRAYTIALHVHKTSLDFPKIEQFALSSQIRRASKGICANIAEGFAKQHRSGAEFKRFLLMAVGSSEEMIVWTNFCKDLGYIGEKQSLNWISEYQQIARMTNGLIEGWKN